MRSRVIRKSTIFLLFLMLGVVLVGCQSGNIHDNEVDVVVINSVNEVDSSQIQIQHLKDEQQHLLNVIKQLTSNMSDGEMLEFSRNQYDYDLRVNGESVPKDGAIVISPGDVEILLSERSSGYEFLSPEWLEAGRISGDAYIDHIIDLDTTDWTPTGSDGTVVSSRGYQTSNITKGEQISFTITDELKQRLNLNTNLIQIEVSEHSHGSNTSQTSTTPADNHHVDEPISDQESQQHDKNDISGRFQLGDDGYWRDTEDGSRIREIWTFDEEGNQVQITMEEYLELISGARGASYE